jgi:hypothetical protein
MPRRISSVSWHLFVNTSEFNCSTHFHSNEQFTFARAWHILQQPFFGGEDARFCIFWQGNLQNLDLDFIRNGKNRYRTEVPRSPIFSRQSNTPRPLVLGVQELQTARVWSWFGAPGCHCGTKIDPTVEATREQSTVAVVVAGALTRLSPGKARKRPKRDRLSRWIIC